jgi:hypothetical protein
MSFHIVLGGFFLATGVAVLWFGSRARTLKTSTMDDSGVQRQRATQIYSARFLVVDSLLLFTIAGYSASC